MKKKEAEIQLEINIHPDPEFFRVVFRSRG